MTKADQIRRHYDGVKTTREIARIVGCGIEYVRVCARQRCNGKASSSDIKYRPTRARLEVEAWRAGDAVKARRAYRKARQLGLSVEAARDAYTVARMKDGRRKRLAQTSTARSRGTEERAV